MATKNLSDCFILLSYDGGFNPLFNPGSKERFADPIQRLTQSFIDRGGFDKSIGNVVKISPLKAETMIGKTLPHVLDELVSAFRDKKHRGRKWKFRLPNEEGSVTATDKADECDVADSSVETVEINLEQMADTLELLYRAKSGWRKSVGTVVSCQGRTLAMLAYVTVMLQLGKSLTEALADCTFESTMATSTTVEELEVEIILDNADTGKVGYPLSQTIRHWIRVKRLHLAMSAHAIAIKLGGILVNSKGEVKNGINDKARGCYRLIQRHGKLIQLYKRLCDKMPEGASYVAGESPVPADKLHRMDLNVLTGHVNEKTKFSLSIDRVFEAFGIKEAEYKAAGVPASAEVVEAYLEYVSFGTIKGKTIAGKKSNQALTSDQLKTIEAQLQEAGLAVSFSMPVCELLNYILKGDDGAIQRLAQESLSELA